MTAAEDVVGILGGTSPLAPHVAAGLTAQGTAVLRFSRQAPESTSPQVGPAGPPVDGTLLGYHAGPEDLRLGAVISLMPIWELPAYFGWLDERRCRRLVALSSTSRFTKAESARPHDRALAERLREGEEAVEAWAAVNGASVTILRPTMVYGGNADGNVSEMRRLLHRARVVPLVGDGAGLRQPVHMLDVASAAVSASRLERTPHSAYDIAGGEVLTYRELVDRIRGTVPGPTFVLRVPGLPFRVLERAFPGSRRLSLAAGMVERMGTDMVFDHAAARADLDHDPRPFAPGT